MDMVKKLIAPEGKHRSTRYPRCPAGRAPVRNLQDILTESGHVPLQKVGQCPEKPPITQSFDLLGLQDALDLALKVGYLFLKALVFGLKPLGRGTEA